MSTVRDFGIISGVFYKTEALNKNFAREKKNFTLSTKFTVMKLFIRDAKKE
jgi:hypothetical protein